MRFGRFAAEIGEIGGLGTGRIKIAEKIVKRRFVARFAGIVPLTVLFERILLEIVFIGMGHLLPPPVARRVCLPLQIKQLFYFNKNSLFIHYLIVYRKKMVFSSNKKGGTPNF